MVISYGCPASTEPTCVFVALLLVLVTSMVHVHGLSPPEFLSIDCGLGANDNPVPYTDITTGLHYKPDNGYVDGGFNQQISKEFRALATSEQEKTLRSFPDGLRNCYTLKYATVTGKKYLLRATFTYGNYDGLNKSLDGSLFLFRLYIGVNFWTTVNLTNWHPSLTIWKEVLTMATDNYTSVCLVNTGSGTPFISVLELRPLQDAMYSFVNTSVSVSYINRIRFGKVDNNITRYPVDLSDRFWENWIYTSNPWLNLKTSKQLNRLTGNEFQVPSEILQQASSVVTDYPVPFINISVTSGDNMDAESLEFLPIFHFAEIGNSSANRTFNIHSAGKLIFPNFSPSQLRVDSKYEKGRFVRNPTLSFSLTMSPNSKLGPLINAFELYSFLGMENFTAASDDVKYINEVKNNYDLAMNWSGDPCSPIEYAWKGLTCDYSKKNRNPRIIQVNLSGRGLRGGLAISFMNMSSLESLDLSHNNLKGAIPDYHLNSLQVLNLSNNQFEGPIPDSILQRFQTGLLELRLEGNPICSKVKDTYCSNKKKKKNIWLIVVIVPVASLLAMMCILWKLSWQGKSGDHEDYAMYEEETPLYIDIRRFTSNFQSIIGKGGFGTVYHGILENGGEVAVKVLMETSISESTDFLPEVQTLSKVHHKNLVALQGYCQNKKCLALVYDFMPRGNLQHLLRGGHDLSPNWEERLRIAVDAAQGLEYLHESCTPSIVHRDVKTSNILLDKNLVGIISDFGLSRAFNDAHTHISTVAAGTLGYLDPEYHATFQLTAKTDVYSFGIVLLEIVTGQPPVFMDPQTVHLPNWVRQKVAQGSVHDVVDKRLKDQYDAGSLQCVIEPCLELPGKCSRRQADHDRGRFQAQGVLAGACFCVPSTEQRYGP